MYVSHSEASEDGSRRMTTRSGRTVHRLHWGSWRLMLVILLRPQNVYELYQPSDYIDDDDDEEDEDSDDDREFLATRRHGTSSGQNHQLRRRRRRRGRGGRGGRGHRRPRGTEEVHDGMLIMIHSPSSSYYYYHSESTQETTTRRRLNHGLPSIHVVAFNAEIPSSACCELCHSSGPSKVGGELLGPFAEFK